MGISDQLFVGPRICLASIDHEKDAEVEARWTQNPKFLRMMDTGPARPMSAAQVKKKYEKLEKQAEEDKNFIHFAVRTLPSESEPEGRLLGLAEVYWIEWTHSTGSLRLGLGDPQDWGKGYGSEILGLMLRYVFGELNLRRISAVVPAYNEPARRLFQKAGFVEEVRRREAFHRDGARWDAIHFGMLGEEWAQSHTAPAGEQPSGQ